MANELRVLLIGDDRHAEFRAAIESLAATTSLTRAADPATALAQFDAENPPDLIVVAQPYSGCVRDHELDPWRARAPLARVIVLLGSWCEGETRSGLPIHGATRIYWHQWSARWERELARLGADRCPAWGLPVTATDDERLLHFADDVLPQLQGTAAIVAAPETAIWLADVCRGLRLVPLELAVRDVRSRQRPACDLAIIEVDALGYDTREEALPCARGWRGAPLVALCEFPRLEDYEAWTTAGVAVVLARPVLVDDLRWHITAQLSASAVARR
jgi:hypothetical protein